MIDQSFFIHNWVSIITIAGLGILSIFNLIDRAATKKRSEVDRADDRLMGIMQATVSQLEKKTELASKDLVDTQLRLTTLEAENKIIKDIFQGRDDTMQTFMKQGFAAMATMPEVTKMIAATNENVGKLYESIQQLIQNIKPIK